jgi:hypothetical protein
MCRDYDETNRDEFEKNLDHSADITPVCPHCNQKFASQNNLGRHMVDVHKRTLDGNDIQESAEGIHVAQTGECTRCNPHILDAC